MNTCTHPWAMTAYPQSGAGHQRTSASMHRARRSRNSSYLAEWVALLRSACTSEHIAKNCVLNIIKTALQMKNLTILLI